ncbi:hypothetical protein GCM10009737_32460 [Nocardioides lentus]|uniref:Uncharacterized protein n=1 Tax=Nocardioides lentus TaxID=338077 RepID=A0ABN2PPQ1_9ACTN
MSGKAWAALIGFVMVALVGLAIAYYRAGGETSWPFIGLMAFAAVWLPLQVWGKRRMRARLERIEREG